MFLQLEHLACPLMYIVGEDDLSSSSIENANLVGYFLILVFFFLTLQMIDVGKNVLSSPGPFCLTCFVICGISKLRCEIHFNALVYGPYSYWLLL